MRLLRKITYGEFSEFVQEKKSTYSIHTQSYSTMLKRVNIVTPIFEPISGEEKSVKSPKFHSHTSKPPIVVKPSRRDDFYANNELLVCSSFSKQMTVTRVYIFW